MKSCKYCRIVDRVQLEVVCCHFDSHVLPTQINTSRRRYMTNALCRVVVYIHPYSDIIFNSGDMSVVKAWRIMQSSWSRPWTYSQSVVSCNDRAPALVNCILQANFHSSQRVLTDLETRISEVERSVRNMLVIQSEIPTTPHANGGRLIPD